MRRLDHREFEQYIALLTDPIRKRYGIINRTGGVLLQRDGGPGSGNWGHAGRPGMRGGSAPGSGGESGGILESPVNLRMVNETSDYHTSWKREIGKLPMTAAITIEGEEGTFYRNGQGQLVDQKTGKAFQETEIAGKKISYTFPKLEVDQVYGADYEMREKYASGKVDPKEKITGFVYVKPLVEGLELVNEDGNIYRVKDGKWQEIGPGGALELPSYKANGRAGGVFTGNLYEFSLLLNGVNQKTVDMVAECLDLAPQVVKDSYVKALSYANLTADTPNDQPSSYNARTGDVSLHKWDPPGVVLHELGHYIDGAPKETGIKLSGLSKHLDQFMTADKQIADRKKLGVRLKLNTDEQGNFTDSADKRGLAFYNFMERFGSSFQAGNSTAFSDIVSSISGGCLNERAISGGHTQQYWEEKSTATNIGSKRNSEVAANFLQIMASRHSRKPDGEVITDKSMYFLKQVAPNMTNELNRIVNEG